MIKQIDTDLIVVGGGLSGTLAAIAAKRVNPTIDVWIIERFGFLGGMATAGYVFPFMRYHTWDGENKKLKRLSGGLFKELLDIMHDLGYTEKHKRGNFYARFDPIMMRCVLDTMVEKEGINLLYHAIVNQVDCENKNGDISINKIHAQTKAGTIVFCGKKFIDATGDADLVYHTKVDIKKGRQSDGLSQPGTLMFRMGKIKGWKVNRSAIKRKVLEEKAGGNPLTPRDDCLMFIGRDNSERHFNQTRVAQLDFTDPFEMTAAEIEGRKQAERFIQFLRKKVSGFKNSNVMSMGSQIGVRETRRIIGYYELTEDDLQNCVQFEDRIGLGNYPVDIHDPKGTAKTDIRRIPEGKWYTIPYRSLVPKGISNVIVAGRPISTTHAAHSAIRVMPICSVIGQAAGIAAAIGLTSYENKKFIDIPVEEIQEIIRKQDGIID